MFRRKVFQSFLVTTFVLGCIMILVSSSSPSQDPFGETVQTLLKNPKLNLPPAVLEDFVESGEPVQVIVNLHDPFVPGRETVVRNFKDVMFREQLQNEVTVSQDRVIETLNVDDVLITNRFVYVFGFSAEVNLPGLQKLLKNSEVLSIDEDVIIHANLAQGVPLMNASSVRSDYNGSGIAIAICDTGIDYTHSWLGNGSFPNTKVIGGYDTGQNDTDPMDGNGHGTACAGIAAGDLGTTGDYIGGVAYNAKLYALKMTYDSSSGSAYTSDMVEAWEWCVTHQNDAPGNPIMIISTSFGGGRYYNQTTCDAYSTAMTTAASNAKAAGMTLFVSTGNDGFCDSTGWPGCLSDVIGVGAVYDADVGQYPPPGYVGCIDAGSCAGWTSGCPCSSGNCYIDYSTAADQVTTYSNSASFMALFAPSNQAYTTDAGGGFNSSFGGTSAACPYAAGAGASLQSAAMDKTGAYLTPDLVEHHLVTYGDDVTDSKVAITKPRVNLGNSVDALPDSVCEDNDGDGYGDPESVYCTHPDLDCDDTNGDIHPNADEVCDGIDNNCAAGIDEEPAATESCDNGAYCDGQEACSTGTCQSGTPVDCNDGVGCTDDSCNETTDSCENMENDSNCDDGLWCNGAETCDTVSDCQAGTAPDCDDGAGCTVDSCNEATDSCDNVPSDALCDDGLFCNGAEACVDGLCEPGADPCPGDGNDCTDDCNEASDTCAHLCNATDDIDPCCDDSACSGSPICEAPQITRYFEVNGGLELWNWTENGKTKIGQDVSESTLPGDMADPAKLSWHDENGALQYAYANFRPVQYSQLNDWKSGTAVEIVSFKLAGMARGMSFLPEWGELLYVTAIGEPTASPGFDSVGTNWFAHNAYDDGLGGDVPSWWCEAQGDAIDKDVTTGFSDLVAYTFVNNSVNPDGTVDLWISGLVTTNLAGMLSGTAEYGVLEGAIHAAALSDEDGDGFFAERNDCDDDASNDPVECNTCSCGDAGCAPCARCINPDAQEFSGDTIDSNCNLQNDCFIATAVFDSGRTGGLTTLRLFRDDVLLKRDWGIKLVDVYYRFSPPLAKYIEEHPRLRPLVRTLLLPMVGGAFLVTGEPSGKMVTFGFGFSGFCILLAGILKSRRRNQSSR